MLASLKRRPILEWLQLHPGLLSAARPGTVARPAPAPAAAPATPPAEPTPEPTVASAPISTQTVLPWAGTMTFYQPGDGPSAPVRSAYAGPAQGGTERAALAEMTGYLSTRLQP